MSEQIPSEEWSETIGKLADTCDNLHVASGMPLPADVHLTILRTNLLDLRDQLRAIHVEMTGVNPWSK